MKKQKLKLLQSVGETSVFRTDKDVATAIRAQLNALADLVQEAKERGIIVSFNIGDNSSGRSSVTSLEIVKKVL